MVFAVILAGGTGSRMGSNITKQRMLIAGKPVIWHTATAFDRCPDIDRIVVVSRADEIEYMRNALSGIRKLFCIVEGGATRAESSYRGICAAGDACSIIAIHDAARCLITPEGISKVIDMARINGAATAAGRLNDTVKRVDEHGQIIETIDRSTLVAVEPPQVFSYSSIRSAFESASSLGAGITDDNMIYESAGGRICTVDPECDNFKITTPRDLILAELIIKERENV